MKSGRDPSGGTERANDLVQIIVRDFPEFLLGLFQDILGARGEAAGRRHGVPVPISGKYESEPRKAHILHGPGRGAYVAGMGGIEQNNAYM